MESTYRKVLPATARDLRILQSDAGTLQRIAAQQLNLVVPEPASVATVTLGLELIGITRRRKRTGK